MLAFSGCKTGKTVSSTTNSQQQEPGKISAAALQEIKDKYPNENLVIISTSYGEMIARLFNETPLHRDNFLKLTEKKYYDSLLFHRVINSFMIQGGDPDSKNAKADKLLGDGDIGYTVPAEFNQKLFHKKGVLCAAREGDDINPQKASSGCQFYIVQGKGFNDETLKKVEYRINRPILHQLTKNYLETPGNETIKQRYESYQKEGKKDSLDALKKKIDSLIIPEYEKTEHYTFSEEQRTAYKTIGGTPHLDGSYTVYGEIIYGLSLIDKIAAVGTDKNDRPLTDVRMTVRILKRVK
ncbi:MAG TPA: peptidylprolyl isomerase [Bacteroidia bacterium]